MRLTGRTFRFFIATSLTLLTLSACNGTDASLDMIQGRDQVDGRPGIIPPYINPEYGSGCDSTDRNHICLGMKYVAYRDGAGNPVVSESEARAVVSEINELWKQCNLSFVIEDYQAVDPADYGLAYQTANLADLTTIRNRFSNDHTILAVTTGTWNRGGTLGNTGANAWTSLPGGGPYGAIMERTVGKTSNLIAHELGHYLNLLHISDSNAMMSPIIYGKSTAIYDSQCSTARSAALYFWSRMLR